MKSFGPISFVVACAVLVGCGPAFDLVAPVSESTLADPVTVVVVDTTAPTTTATTTTTTTTTRAPTVAPTAVLPPTVVPQPTAAPATAANGAGGGNSGQPGGSASCDLAYYPYRSPSYSQINKLVQTRLAALGYNPGEIDGYFGPNSFTALDNWAGDGLVRDGRERILFAHDIEAVYVITDLGYVELGIACGSNQGGGGSTGGGSSARVECDLEYDPAKPASYSEINKLVQTRLAALGYDPGAVDGYFGPNSLRALLAWSKDGPDRIAYLGVESDIYVISVNGYNQLGIDC